MFTEIIISSVLERYGGMKKSDALINLNFKMQHTHISALNNFISSYTVIVCYEKCTLIFNKLCIIYFKSVIYT